MKKPIPTENLKYYPELPADCQQFVDYFMEERSPARAIRRCGFTGRTATKAGWEMMNQPGVRDAIREMELAQGALHRVTPEHILETLGSLLRFDPRSVYHMVEVPGTDGSQGPLMREELLPMSQWPDDAAAAFVSFDAHGNPKFVQRTDTLLLAMKHFGMLIDRAENLNTNSSDADSMSDAELGATVRAERDSRRPALIEHQKTN